MNEYEKFIVELRKSHPELVFIPAPEDCRFHESMTVKSIEGEQFFLCKYESSGGGATYIAWHTNQAVERTNACATPTAAFDQLSAKIADYADKMKGFSQFLLDVSSTRRRKA